MDHGVEDAGEEGDADDGADEREHAGGDRDPLPRAPEFGQLVRERLALGRRAENQCHAEHLDRGTATRQTAEKSGNSRNAR